MHLFVFLQTTTSIVGRAIVEGKDEKTSEKFRKLMGIKSTYKLAPNDHLGMSTHMHRGQGLGFASIGPTDPNISK